ncbi:hypothetical protein LIER_26322 [Lithospermum erythrorhizon]|uniref:Serine-rich protein-like protein n=1 Tax=Lithospermum erythrorhizon TaxID=34254 RepID=A0AAV3R871_LITER
MAATSRRSYNGPVLRSISPTRCFSSSSSYLTAPINSSSSLRFSLDRRARSPNRSISHSPDRNQVLSKKPAQRRSCMCSPTNHPGSFRCRLHKNISNNDTVNNKLRRWAMVNSVVKRSLASLIRPSSHQLRRRENFQRRTSRLSKMSKTND